MQPRARGVWSWVIIVAHNLVSVRDSWVKLCFCQKNKKTKQYLQKLFIQMCWWSGEGVWGRPGWIPLIRFCCRFIHSEWSRPFKGPFKTERWEHVHLSQLLVLILTSHFDALPLHCFCFWGKWAALSLDSFAAACIKKNLCYSDNLRMKTPEWGGYWWGVKWLTGRTWKQNCSTF